MNLPERFAALGTAEEQRYRLLVDSITDYAIYMLDREGMISSWNAGARRFKGYEAHEVIGTHFSRFYTEEDRRKGLPEKALRTAETEGRFEAEGWRVRKDGTRFWAHIVIDPIRDESGTLIGFAKITRDLSERIHARDELRKSEQQFRRLVQGVTDYAIYMLDADGRVSSWNIGAQRIKGYTPDEIIGEHFSKFYTDEDRAAGLPKEGLAAAASTGRWEREGWRVRKDGTRFLAHVIIDAIRDESGELIGFAKVTRDVTERKRTQDALEHAQRALFHSQKMESIGQLTGGVAHDFNNLLTAIINSLELLRKRLPDDPRARSLLDNALYGAERGATLTKRMLAFARRQELHMEAVDVADLIGQTIGLLERAIGPDIAIQTNIPAGLAPIHTDANQLETALLNLGLNSRDAMPHGGRIVIAARHASLAPENELGLKSGDYVELSVADTGVGMDEATRARAIEPFFTTKGTGKGTGLGLSMVQGLVEQSGGKLVLSSRANVGTTVAMWFCVAAHEPQEADDKRQAQPSAARPNTRILVVDDDPLVRLSACALLEDIGYEVVEADGGMRALQLLAGDRSIDLVLTDQVMPEMTGMQLIEAIRGMRPDLPIVLATGYAELPAALPANARRLSKPFRPGELQETIAAVLAGRTPRR